jgi:hypothetical protein
MSEFESQRKALKLSVLLEVALKGGLSHNRMSSENNPMTVPLHCGQNIVLLTCCLKEENPFPDGNS